ncbi:MAG TPA: hypothetical protein VF468_09530 [Actinomycetota bacterium]|nr:hypothetical protein [Actinomycetota bacterium]
MTRHDEHRADRPVVLAVVAPPAGIDRARTLLAELADRGAEWFGHGEHLAVLRAFDTLEDAATTRWPPPGPATGITDPHPVLLEAYTRLREAATGDDTPCLDQVRIALAAAYLADTLRAGP